MIRFQFKIANAFDASDTEAESVSYTALMVQARNRRDLIYNAYNRYHLKSFLAHVMENLTLILG